MSAERGRVDSFGRLDQGLRQASDWYLWGPYLSERQWGTVREDYSADGDAWSYLPHDHARSVAYRWGEDGLAGFSDIEQRLCLALALWNGRDAILKERVFGLNSYEGNHGEDAKEYWWYLDALPSHASNTWRYHYPQQEYPYEDLLQENQTRSKDQPEYELLDTGIFDDDRYWIVDVEYTKADPTDVLMSITITNAGPSDALLHVLPTLWYRNTWSWDDTATAPTMSGTEPGTVTTTHPFLGDLQLLCGPNPGGAPPTLLFCDNVTNMARIYDQAELSPYPTDGINDHVVTGAATVNPALHGSKCAAWYQVSVGAGQSVELRLRLRPPSEWQGAPADPLGEEFAEVRARRRGEADEFYAELTPAAASSDEAAVMRQAFAGMLWSKQLYYYDVAQWLDGDPGQPAPPPQRLQIRNAQWRNFQAFDIMSMPDTWEYPWFAAWDLAFQCVALAHVDPAFAKYQLSLLCREWFQHPNGALPSYEWNFSDLNPPVQAWAALEVFAIDEGRDMDFLSRIFDKLLVNFTWWVNREDADGSNLFEGGFLGLDNIGPLNRSELPFEGILEQSDATGWMATYALSMAQIAAVLHGTRYRPALDLVQKFAEHFALIADALDTVGVWDETDGLFYDRIVLPDGTIIPIRVHSMVAMIPLLASAVIDQDVLDQSLVVGKRFADYLHRRGLAKADEADTELLRVQDGQRRLLLGVLSTDRLRRMLSTLFDPAEFLSPHGLRSLSAYHREHPYILEVNGWQAGIDYEPAESTTGMFGGNSNWRGPVWFPLNYLVASALERYHHFCGQELLVEYPTGSGIEVNLGDVADDLWDRLVSLFLVDANGTRPCFGTVQRLQTDPRWRDNLLFHEYFHGDTGAGLGASHQTGWTGLVADVIRRRHGAVPPMAEVLSRLMAGDRAQDS